MLFDSGYVNGFQMSFINEKLSKNPIHLALGDQIPLCVCTKGSVQPLAHSASLARLVAPSSREHANSKRMSAWTSAGFRDRQV